MTAAFGPWAVLLVALVLARLMATLGLSLLQSRTVKRGREQVPEAFAGVLSLDAHHRAADYTLARERANRWSAVWQAALVLLWTLGGGLHAIEALVRAAVTDATLSGRVLEGCVVGLLYATCDHLLGLPEALWRTFGVEQRFGFNRTTPKTFALDQLKGAVLGLGLALPLWAAILGLLEQRGPWAWLYAWGCYAAVSLVLLWAGPRIIAPMFNTFRPLTDHPVKGRIDALMARAGYGHGGLFVMNGSARSTHGNAYFTGLGRHKRVVFFDTLLTTLADDEVEGVLAHELGHFALKHIHKQLLASLILSLGLFKLAAWVLSTEGLYDGLGLPGAGLGVRLIALGMVGSAVGFWLTPLFAWLSRRREFEADAYACAMADGAALGRALLKLFVDNGATLTPHAAYVAFYHSHPDAVHRLERLTAHAIKS